MLHILAQGGFIRFERATNGKVFDVTCFTRDGFVLSDCTVEVFQRLKNKRLIRSFNSKPYRISREGRLAVRSQPDNR